MAMDSTLMSPTYRRDPHAPTTPPHDHPTAPLPMYVYLVSAKLTSAPSQSCPSLVPAPFQPRQSPASPRSRPSTQRPPPATP
ncbi:hypothetical protein E2C01_046528 [Portunus trituberculatus]|uniref:Uncharacterized protein n=1 Tax=Portunus trituberculatus TaxID=210409 RepID=A0A5B7G192_PORTR|nr:hypothetical protein [Portunus trituberculatus]